MGDGMVILEDQVTLRKKTIQKLQAKSLKERRIIKTLLPKGEVNQHFNAIVKLY